jgi:hypothetical protein
MKRLVRWVVIGPLAVTALLAIVAGGPVLLLMLGGNPLPERMLGPGDMLDLLTRPDDGRLLLWVLSMVGWVAWAVVAGSVLLELGAQLTGRRTPHLPGLAGPQRLANVLVAGVLAALTTPGISHAHAAYLDTPVTAEVAAAPVPQPLMYQPMAYEQPQWQAPHQFPEQPPEREEPLVHEVARGDWMWHIAGRYLGDEERYPEIAELNPDYARRYVDYPDHIEPGDLLVLPPDARDRGERGHAAGELIEPEEAERPEPPPAEPEPEPEPPEETESPPPAVPPAPEPTTPAVPTPSQEAAAPPPVPTPEPPSEEAAAPPPVVPAPGPPTEDAAAPPPVPNTDPPPPEEAEAPAPPPGARDTDDRERDQDQDLGDPVLTGVTPLLCIGVLASVLVGALLVFRLRKLARRRHRRAIVSAADAAAESSLRSAATADVVRLDQALRVLAVALAEARQQLPDIGAVWIGEGEIHLILTAPAEIEPPLPFHTAGPGSWFLPADAPLPEVDGVMAPLPALVTIGSQPGQHLLIDLERMGMLTVTGHPERCSDLLRYLVAELAHNPWSDRVEVTLAGFAPDPARALASLNPDRVTVADSLPEAADALRRRLVHTTAALDAHELADSVDGRIGDTAADTWTPHLLIVNRPRPEHDELLAELETALTEAGRRCAVAVATTAPSGVGYGRRSITITDEGLLKAGFLHESHPMPAVALPEHLLAPLADLLRNAADEQDHPIPAATEPWAGDTDATGSILLPEPPKVTGHTANGGGGVVLRSVELPIIGPNVYEDPALDEVVAEWMVNSDELPRIALLGPIRVAAGGPPPSNRARVCRELIVYLAACGDRGADPGEIARHLWPNRTVQPTVRTEVLANARRWLGTAPDGGLWLPEAGADGRYRLRSGILIDWHLFRRLRTRGERRGLAGAEDLRTALQLVRGAPLADAEQHASGSVRVPYSWLPGSAIQPELILAGVLDTAHELVSLSLTSGDLETARWAIHQAWLADPHRGDDHPWRDLLRIAHARGDHDEVREVVADLLRWRDAEHPDELSPETQRLISSLLTNVAGRL